MTSTTQDKTQKPRRYTRRASTSTNQDEIRGQAASPAGEQRTPTGRGARSGVRGRPGHGDRNRRRPHRSRLDKATLGAFASIFNPQLREEEEKAAEAARESVPQDETPRACEAPAPAEGSTRQPPVRRAPGRGGRSDARPARVLPRPASRQKEAVPAASREETKVPLDVQDATTAQAPGTTAEAPAARPDGPVSRVLVCWVGKADMNSAQRREHGNPGPIRLLLERTQPFDRAILLLNGNQDVREPMAQWLSPFISRDHLEMRRVRFNDLTDHVLVTGVLMAAVEHAIALWHLPPDGTGIFFHLSPGTPTTHALLVLLACVRYRGVRMLQTRLPSTLGQQSEVHEVSMPAIETLLRKEAGAADGDGEMRTCPAAFADVIPDADALPDTAQPIAPAHQHTGTSEGKEPQPLPESPFAHLGGRRHTAAVRPEIPWPNPVPILDMDRPGPGEPATICKPLGDVYARMEQVSQTPLPILLTGEDGCGRSRLAKYIHKWSGRSGKFVGMDCAGLSDALFEAELFGRTTGDTAGFWGPREGKLRMADGGTLLLENVDRLTLTQQIILLHLLALHGETTVNLPARGGKHGHVARLRIISTASTDLADKIRLGLFSGDLYYRLAGVSARLPAVREYSDTERENLLRRCLLELQHRERRFWNFDGDAWQALIDEPWPGNLREIYRTLQKTCLLAEEGTTITREEVLHALEQSRIALLPEDRQGRVCLSPQGSEPVGSLQQLGAEVARRMEYERATRAVDEAVAMTQERAHPGMGEIARSRIPARVVLPGRARETTRRLREAKREAYEREHTILLDDAFTPNCGRNLNEDLDALRLSAVLKAHALAGGDDGETARLLGMSTKRVAALLAQAQHQDGKA